MKLQFCSVVFCFYTTVVCCDAFLDGVSCVNYVNI